jgi:hypothetical protein
MDKNNLPGLSPLWLISLGLILGCVIVVMIPASIATGEAIKSSDWIGFAGNVVAGAMTLIAAIIAWFAVQKQITIQREIAESQAAIGRFNILQAQLAILENETRLTSSISIEAKWAVLPQSTYLAGPGLVKMQVESALEEYQKRTEAITSLEHEFEMAGTQRWAFDGGKTRMSAFRDLIKLKIGITRATGVLKNALIYQIPNNQFRPQDQAACLAVDLTAERDQLVDVAEIHLNTIYQEIARLSDLVRVVRDKANL